MKIAETHKNGAKIEVSGLFGVHKTISAWREAQNRIPKKKVAKKPKVTGTSTSFLGGDRREYETAGVFTPIPVVQAKQRNRFGFQPND